MVAISILLIIVIVSGIVANNKNRSVTGWCIGTLLFMPIILILLVLKPVPKDVYLNS